MTEEQIRQLLRQRANRQAPDGYYQSLLHNIHRKQRSELLKQPLWKIALERITTFWGEHSLSPATYTAALASLTLGGVLAILSLKPSSSTDPQGAVAKSSPQIRTEVRNDIVPTSAIQENSESASPKKRPVNITGQ